MSVQLTTGSEVDASTQIKVW